MGTRVQGLRVESAGNDTVLRYDLADGTYEAYIEILFKSFDPNKVFVKRIPAFEPVITDRIEVKGSLKIANRQRCSLQDNICHGSWDMHGAALDSGRWRMNRQPELALSVQNATYQPDQCSLPEFRPLRSVELPLCIVGDSHARHLSEMLDVLYRGEAPQVASAAHTDRYKPHDSNVTYYDDNYGLCAAEIDCSNNRIRPKVDDCKVMIFLVGQWRASEGVPVPDFYKEFSRALHAIKTKYPATKVLVATVQPHGDLSNRDPRSSAVLSAYASATLSAAASHEMPAVDMHCWTDVLHDITYDGAHYKTPLQYQTALYAHGIVEDLVYRGQLP